MKYFYLTVLALLLVSCGNEKNIPSGSGLIETTEVTFSAQASGQLMALRFDEGDNVKIGDTLGVIDTTNVMLKYRQAEASAEAAQTKSRVAQLNISQASNNLDLAGKEFDRVSSLIKTGSADQQQFDRARNSQKQARLTQEQAQVSLRAALADYSNASAQLALLQKQKWVFPG